MRVITLHYLNLIPGKASEYELNLPLDSHILCVEDDGMGCCEVFVDQPIDVEQMATYRIYQRVTGIRFEPVPSSRYINTCRNNHYYTSLRTKKWSSDDAV